MTVEFVSPSSDSIGSGIIMLHRWQRSVPVHGVVPVPLARVSSDIVTAAGLYLLGAAILLSPLGNHPSFSYNWEQYTAWHVFSTWYDGFRPADAFAVTDGLMTDSGQGPLVGLPAWLGFRLLGPSVAAMRIPVILVAALAAPLLWLVGRRLVGSRAAGLAALMLAVSPVWLLYGRTATQVGISLVPMLLTVWVLLDVLDGGPHWWRSVALLQVALIGGIYAYAPIRFLWPIALGLLVLRAVRSDARRRYAVALALTACVLPIALVLIGWVTAPDAAATDALVAYYNARGEQLVGLHYQPEHYGQFIDVPDDAKRQPEPALAGQLLRRNTAVLGRLLLDQGTGPALTNFDNPAGQPIGRLYPGLLFPFLVAGLLATGQSAISRRTYNDLVLIALSAGFTLPILLTSRVHIGRLVFALPFLFLLVAKGAAVVAEIVGRWIPGPAGPGLPSGRLVFAGLAIVLVVTVAWSAIEEEHVVVPEPRAVRVASAMAGDVSEVEQRGGAVWLSDEEPLFEAIHVAEVRLYLNDIYDFIDLNDPEDRLAARPAGGRPPVYYGGIVARGFPRGMPAPCHAVAFVDRVAAASLPVGGLAGDCAEPPQYVLLPE